MSKEQHSEISRLGGKSVKPENRKFSRDPEYAKACGRKGGLVKKKKDS